MSFTNGQPSPLEHPRTNLLASVFGTDGFWDQLQLQPSELDVLRGLVERHWRARLQRHLLDSASLAMGCAMPDYHRILAAWPSIDHSALWPKASRILPAEDVGIIRAMPFMAWLAQECGQFLIANEERVAAEEIYWRLTRPDSSSDVGPIHADKWFWDLGHGNMPAGYQRIKVWIPLYCEAGSSGLRYVPRSHLQDWPYTGVERGGMIKPQIQVTESDLPLQLFHTQPGQAIVFNDALLHGGLIGGVHSRVSIEFTMLVPLANCRCYLEH